MTKDYQRTGFDTSPLAVPERVSVAMAEIAEDIREGLLALAVGAGLQVMGTLMEADVAALCGPRGKHDPGRTASGHGSGRGSVTLGGRRVPVTRPRVRAADGSGELPVPAYELFMSPEKPSHPTATLKPSAQPDAQQGRRRSFHGTRDILGQHG